MAADIHPTAIVDTKATIGEGCVIGPFTVIGPEVTLGAGCVIGPRVSLDWLRAGANVTIGANTLVGGDPQVYNWKNVPSWVEIGDGALINELTAIHRSMYEGKSTVIGAGCFVMTQVHIGHDCQLGKEITVTTLAGLSGHVSVDDYAVIGGGAGIHQFVRVGAMAMVGGMSRIVQDVPPYFTVAGNPAASFGLNAYALKKRGMSLKDRVSLKNAYHILARSNLPLTDAIAKIESQGVAEGPLKNVVEFAKSSERGLTL
ncbi:MAG: acyl-ACP--UDP-N-acetylglucosamine O-acyltransferase [Nitrospinae bacterium]|nr:acyl-ACP--UDP-N-acetylglucosamine O-acyltransferase [Nitrospinota bacterium]